MVGQAGRHKSTKRAKRGFWAIWGRVYVTLSEGIPLCHLRVAYRRVLGHVAKGLFKIPSKPAVWMAGIVDGGAGR